MKRDGSRITRERGFILAATLWLIAFLAVAAGFIAEWTDETRQQAFNQQLDLQAELDYQGTLATILFLASTRRINEFGIFINELTDQQQEDYFFNGVDSGIQFDDGTVIKLYDQAYQGIGSSIFSIQDESGLIATNSTDPTHLKYLLSLFGLKPKDQDEAIDKLLDYQDIDHLHRLNGAEEAQYRKKNKPEPPNRPLLTSWELQNILDWDQYPVLWKHDLPRLTSSLWEGSPNINAAPPSILQTLNGITREDANKLAQARATIPLYGLDQISQITGKILFIDPFSIYSKPSNLMRISLWHTGSGRTREIHIELHALISAKDFLLKSTTPWRVHYQLDATKTTDQQNAYPKSVKSDLFQIKTP